MEKPKRDNACKRQQSKDFVFDEQELDDRIGEEDDDDYLIQRLSEASDKGFVMITEGDKLFIVQNKFVCSCSEANLCKDEMPLSDTSAKCICCGARCHFSCSVW